MLSVRFDILIPSFGEIIFPNDNISVIVSVTILIPIPTCKFTPISFGNNDKSIIPFGEVNDKNIIHHEFKKCDVSSSLVFDYKVDIQEEKKPLLVQKALKSFERYDKTVELCEEGVGGTYFVHDDNNEILAVFKPVDEEPGAENNPKKILEHPLLPPGGGAKREVAAYIIDNGHAGVPETHFIHYTDEKGISKNGSIQKYVRNIGDSTTMSSSRFLTSDVHNIGILDIRLFNMDRNGENLLVQKNSEVYQLVPIDHTYILPPTLDSAWFEWQYWRQAKEPFSPDTLKFISEIDVNKDADILRKLGIEEDSINTMIISASLLKIAASEGLNLFEIASIICRRNKNLPSELEKWVAQARESGNFMENFVSICKKKLKRR